MTNVDPQARSLRRARAGLFLAAVVIPAALFSLFERQARRLDALAAEGVPVQAHVTKISRSGTTHYAYAVDGARHTWSVKRSEAPHAVGDRFTATYLPSDPGLSRPYVDASRVVDEAARARDFGWKVPLGLFLFLGIFGLLAHRQLRRRLDGAPSELEDPAAYKRRLAYTAAAMAPLLALIFGFHAQDAAERGESLLPVVLGGGLSLAIIVGVGFYVAREGPGAARERAARLMRWLVPVAVLVGLLRLGAALFA